MSSMSNFVSPFDLLDHDDFMSEPGVETDDESNISNADARGSLTAEHLDPIASRQWKTVLSWVTFHPDDLASFRDREGQTALHHACLFRAPLNVIEAMLFAAPEITMVGNDDGELALHWAVRLALPSQVISILLEARPESAFVKDKRGQTPHLLLWDRHEETLRDVFRIYGRDRTVTFPCWKRIMMLISAHSKTKGVNIDEHPLHAIVGSKCDVTFLSFALKLFHDHIDRSDYQGNLPLHSACMSARDGDILKIVLDAYPNAAFRTNSNGLLPLHLAVQSSMRWEGGLAVLFATNPSALGRTNNGLYPFMIAAACDNQDISTTFSLLRSNPTYARPL